ncbi:MAG: response regulator [Candidatus Aminicenantes bacterium]|nr:response regulator [Candidatus Aminicenantes bacterium]
MKTSNPKAKILVIDDDPDFLKLTSIILESGSFNVLTAMNPKEGRQKLLMEKPDLILLDIMMDSIFDGYSLCHDIKTSKEYRELRDTPVIFVSAVKERVGSRFDFNSSEQGLVGPDDYIDKPVKADDLLARIEKLLEK